MDDREDRPTEAELDALLADARATRKKPTRAMWIAALVVSLLCVIGLAYGLITSWDVEPEKGAIKAAAQTGGSGFGLGVMIGLAAGIALGSLLALRKRQS
ncbi:MAG TPA: LPXTG cell wall anchor domain-containing protein [Kofleriaceae bacterium]|nr:LPXTG cell wall anchor domain-containing protein [Kofleriaceae bacterium]